MALKRQAITNRQLAFSFSGTGNSIRMTYFVFQDELSDAKSDQQMFDYVAATLLANNENERILLSFQFDISHTLQTVDMQVISANQIPSNRIVELKNRGRKMGDFRVAKHIEQYGKIGRNQLCPCGSGMKYKRCHGQNK